MNAKFIQGQIIKQVGNAELLSLFVTHYHNRRHITIKHSQWLKSCGKQRICAICKGMYALIKDRKLVYKTISRSLPIERKRVDKLIEKLFQ